MSKNYQVLAKKIIDIVGVDNVESVTHCQTRLRFVVKDPKKLFEVFERRLNFR